MKKIDLIVIGAGPAGSSCAAFCAEAGMQVLILESSRFPRDKVCGDCLNPSVWPVLESLGIASRVQGLPNSSPKVIRFSVAGHGKVELPLPHRSGEVVIRRREFDALLADRAQELGAFFHDGTPVTSLRRVTKHWEVTTSHGKVWKADRIVAADGRNSTVARHLRMLSSPLQDDRIGLQTHIPHPAGYDGALEMHLYRHGYGGLADLGKGLANLCLVSNSGAMAKLRKEAEAHHQLHTAQAWRSITPISRPNACVVARDGVFLCGDAAAVVEPFTGEGISFALRTGGLLANILTSQQEISSGDAEKKYSLVHREIYGGKIRINQFTRFLSLHPNFAHFIAPHLIRYPAFLSFVTKRVIRHSN